MARQMVLHKDRNRRNAFGGTTYTTLCGRMNAACDDGMNVADGDEDVTCKFCLRKMGAALAQSKGGEDGR